ncbi:hypothetical protein SAMN05216267_102535 [Actinacidiphila rubida]|uniref:Uncharacterized protein n=1 Tax=Actinacidiphila rubida TaxID=310780 RepID=A0A1H8PC20_9ACTN|nr:hypothetical protein [Actinacidiphila rubida]SEO39351.1 hypothetical protein SAMN05216267_102535 [Actinacidiphila rubida]
MLTSPGDRVAPPCQDRAGASPRPTPVFTVTVPEPAPPEPSPAVLAAPLAAVPEPKGCLYALSQPPLMLFLCVIGGLIGGGAAWDLLFV